jgi:hypothetical protein
MFITILFLLAAALGILAVVVARPPNEFRISRAALMKATAAMVFEQVNDFHKWEAWSPWAKLDPNSKSTFSGAASGVGAGFAWAGNSKVGEGRMTIIEGRPNELILIKLEFLKPFTATNTAEFTFKPEGNQTLVTWSMFGKNNFIGKAIGLIMNCDKMIKGQFDKGLVQMKAVVEAKS